MKRLPLKSTSLVVFGAIGLIWLVLTLVVLVGSITGGDPLYTAPPGGLVLPHLSLLGTAYLVASGIMPFVVIGAITSA
jgi:hypothetical protein